MSDTHPGSDPAVGTGVEPAPAVAGEVPAAPEVAAAPAVAGEVPAAVAAVEAARARLAELDGMPVAGHVTTYDEIHGALQDALAGLDGV